MATAPMAEPLVLPAANGTDLRRRELGAFLRSRRERIQPEDLGLRSARRRRTPGLRREEVAQLAGVGITWYTWLEQGRDINFSADLLDRVARALRLSSAEREYFLGLMQRRVVPAIENEESIEAVRRAVEFLPVPALAMTLRWDIVAWNHLIEKIFRDYGAIPEAERNLLRIILTDAKYQSDPEGYDVIARKLLGEFRVDFGQYAGCPGLEQLVEELKQIVPGFAKRWSDVEVSNSPRGSHVQHDEFGDLHFDRVSYVPEGCTFLRVLMFTPRDQQTAKLIDAIRAKSVVTPPASRAGKIARFDVLRHSNRH
jgi:transcriptional regulator with XRE-family HTH domain